MIPLLAASEKGKGQTESAFEREQEMWWRSVAALSRRSSLEWDTLEGDSPVSEDNMSLSERVGLPELEVRIPKNLRVLGHREFILCVAGLTANPKYWFKSDSKLSTAGESWKVLLTEG